MFFWNILILCISLTFAWDIPPANFLCEFAIAHDRSSIIIYLPNNLSKEWINWHKNSFSKYVLWYSALLNKRVYTAIYFEEKVP